jgi:hypothetical protein
VADHLLDVALPSQVLGHVRVLLGLPLVYDFDGDLGEGRAGGREGERGGENVRRVVGRCCGRKGVWTLSVGEALILSVLHADRLEERGEREEGREEGRKEGRVQ